MPAEAERQDSQLPADFHDADSIAQGLGSHDSDGAGRYPLSRRFRRRVGRLRPGACAGVFRRPRASPRAQRRRRRSVQAALRGRRAARKSSAGPHLSLPVSRGRCRVRLAAGETLEQPFNPRHALAQVGYALVNPGDVLVLDRGRMHPAPGARPNRLNPSRAVSTRGCESGGARPARVAGAPVSVQ